MHQMRSSAVGTGRPSSLSACWMDLVIPSLGSDRVPSRSKQITFMESSPPQSSHGVMSTIFAVFATSPVHLRLRKDCGSAANDVDAPLRKCPWDCCGCVTLAVELLPKGKGHLAGLHPGHPGFLKLRNPLGIRFQGPDDLGHRFTFSELLRHRTNKLLAFDF